jgi:hydrogenase maturation protease
MDKVEKIAAAVLYEGYVLWPYRRSTIKNQQRWTLGGVYPRAHSEIHGDSDPWLMQTQCLVHGVAPVVRVAVRFLHVVERQVARRNVDGTLSNVDELQVDDEHYLTWDEAAERDVVLGELQPAQMKTPQRAEINIRAGHEEEPLLDATGNVAGILARSWQSLQGAVEVESEKVDDDLYRLTVRITNTTPWNGEERASTLRRTFVSAHTILTARDGEFVSLMDPPEEFKGAAESCQNIKTWPVLAGEEGDKSTLLSSPIILYDYPQVAPESGGDFYDGAEIDQLLVLNMLSLTDDEKAEIRATDPRARAILERSEAYNAEDFMGLHGVMRDFQVLRKPPEEEMFPVWSELERPAPSSVMVSGVELRKGSRVRLNPNRGADIMDIALAGKTAIIEAIDQDDEEAIHFSVTVEDDPGRELGEARVLGHRFFFKLEEVEPIL